MHDVKTRLSLSAANAGRERRTPIRSFHCSKTKYRTRLKATCKQTLVRINLFHNYQINVVDKHDVTAFSSTGNALYTAITGTVSS